MWNQNSSDSAEATVILLSAELLTLFLGFFFLDEQQQATKISIISTQNSFLYNLIIQNLVSFTQSTISKLWSKRRDYREITKMRFSLFLNLNHRRIPVYIRTNFVFDLYLKDLTTIKTIKILWTHYLTPQITKKDLMNGFTNESIL